MSRILVVEDDVAIRRLAHDLLSDEGYEVATACTGQEALDLLAEWYPECPDLILLDLMMPVMDGETFYRHLPSEARSIPILVLSGSRGAREAAMRLGAAIIQKPFDLDDLLQRVESMLADAVATDPARIERLG